jgi:hypothetical protein
MLYPLLGWFPGLLGDELSPHPASTSKVASTMRQASGPMMFLVVCLTCFVIFSICFSPCLKGWIDELWARILAVAHHEGLSSSLFYTQECYRGDML